MKSSVKKIATKITRGSIKVGKKAVNASPKLKGFLRTNILSAINSPLTNSSAAGLENQYKQWYIQNYPDAIDCYNMKKEQDRFSYKPLISVIVPTYNTPENFFCETVESVLSQVYDNWELILVDDCSPDARTRELIKEYAATDSRIKYKFLKKNHHISGATNEAFKIATGDFILLFDHDDLLWPNALFEVAKAVNNDRNLEFIYTDEDKIIDDDRRNHTDLFFKSDWNPDWLHSANYITHITVVKKDLIDKFGGERGEFNGAQDWEFIMRMTRNIDPAKIHHIPKVVYSWRVSENSTAKSVDAKPYVLEAGVKAVTEDLLAKGYKPEEFVVSPDKKHPGYIHTDFVIKGSPKVSIVIPSKNQFNILKRCLDSIYAKTTYDNFEVVLVDTRSTDKRVLGLYEKFSQKHSNFKKVDFAREKFSYSDACNFGAKNSIGDYLVMLNNDTEVISRNWLEKMLGDAQRPEIGAVGVKLYYPDKTSIQHAGIRLGLDSDTALAANIIEHAGNCRSLNQWSRFISKHNVTAVTAACMMISRKKFDEVKGFDTKLAVTFNDVDLNLKLIEKGYFNLFNPTVELIHHESISVGRIDIRDRKRDSAEYRAAAKLFTKRWGKYLEYDPNYSPNFSRKDAELTIDILDAPSETKQS